MSSGQDMLLAASSISTLDSISQDYASGYVALFAAAGLPYCALCQLPLHCLQAGESVAQHVTRCQMTGFAVQHLLPECSAGVHCASEDRRHFVQYSHLSLLRLRLCHASVSVPSSSSSAALSALLAVSSSDRLPLAAALHHQPRHAKSSSGEIADASCSSRHQGSPAVNATASKSLFRSLTVTLPPSSRQSVSSMSPKTSSPMPSQTSGATPSTMTTGRCSPSSGDFVPIRIRANTMSPTRQNPFRAGSGLSSFSLFDSVHQSSDAIRRRSGSFSQLQHPLSSAAAAAAAAADGVTGAPFTADKRQRSSFNIVDIMRRDQQQQQQRQQLQQQEEQEEEPMALDLSVNCRSRPRSATESWIRGAPAAAGIARSRVRRAPAPALLPSIGETAILLPSLTDSGAGAAAAVSGDTSLLVVKDTVPVVTSESQPLKKRRVTLPAIDLRPSCLSSAHSHSPSSAAATTAAPRVKCVTTVRAAPITLPPSDGRPVAPLVAPPALGRDARHTPPDATQRQRAGSDVASGKRKECSEQLTQTVMMINTANCCEHEEDSAAAGGGGGGGAAAGGGGGATDTAAGGGAAGTATGAAVAVSTTDTAAAANDTAADAAATDTAAGGGTAAASADASAAAAGATAATDTVGGGGSCDGAVSAEKQLDDSAEVIGLSSIQPLARLRADSKSLRRLQLVDRKCPSYKLVADTPFAVDAFGYGLLAGVKAYFLSHFHYDHYRGLSSSSVHPTVYCSHVTGNLVKACLRVPAERVCCLSLNQCHVINDVQVTLLDANHCPGAVMFLFKLKSGAAHLHVGDFRADPAMESYPELWNTSIDRLYLDTTYCDPCCDFPCQTECLQMCVRLVSEAIHTNARTLIVCGSYFIGKERVFKSLAESFGCLVWVSAEKRAILHCLDDESLSGRLTTDQMMARIHVLPLAHISIRTLQSYLQIFQSQYSHLVALKPTSREISLVKQTVAGNVSIFSVPYSEHSSFSELRRFVQFIQPRHVIPTIGGAKSKRCIDDIVDGWLTDRGRGPNPATTTTTNAATAAAATTTTTAAVVTNTTAATVATTTTTAATAVSTTAAAVADGKTASEESVTDGGSGGGGSGGDATKTTGGDIVE